MAKQVDEIVVKAVLVKLLTNLITFFNVGKSMVNEQANETADLILQEYYFLKVEDIKLVFNGMKTGKYLDGGKLFDRLDGGVILQSFKMYAAERAEIAKDLANQTHKQVMEEERAMKKHIICYNDKFVTVVDECYRATKNRDAATRFDYAEAVIVREVLIQDVPKPIIVIELYKKPEIGALREIRKSADLLTLEEKYSDAVALVVPERKQALKTYNELRQQILNDDSLDAYQKHNRVRALSGLAPVGPAEYALHMKQLNATLHKTKKKTKWK